jgi:hypothetical protein
MTTTTTTGSRRLEDIRLVLKDLLKVIKVVSLYPENNPLPQSLRQSFSERLVDVVADYGPVEIDVERERLVLDAETVFADRSKEESLAGLFFDEGIVRFTLKPGMVFDEVLRLLDVFKNYQNSNRHETDLVALLWEASLEHFGYETVEDISLDKYGGDFVTQEVMDGGGNRTGRLQMATDKSESYEAIFEAASDTGPVPAPGAGEGEVDLEVAGLGDEASGGAEVEVIEGSVLDTGDEEADRQLMVSEAVEAMGLSDLTGSATRLPDLHLILSDEHRLSTEETEQAAEVIRDDVDFEMWESTSELCKEILHQESQLSEFNESVTICEKVVVEFVRAGRLTYAAEVLRYFQILEEQLRAERPLWAERLKEGRITSASRERLRILGETLNFTWESLMNITDLIGELSHPQHRDTVRDYLVVRGRDNVRIIARGLHDKRIDVVIATVNVLAQVDDQEALTALRGVAGHAEPEVRRQLACSLQDSTSDGALEILRTLATDSEPSIRSSAVAGIVKHRGQAAFDVIAEIIDDPGFSSQDPDDQQHLLNAYSTLGGDMAVEFLVGLADKHSLFGRDEAAYFRQAAFEALSRNRGELAEKALLKLASSWRGEIKNSARQALQRRRELIYGDSHE